MNVDELKQFMKQNEITPEMLAKAAGMDISTWYRKMQRQGDSFTVKEMNDMILESKMTTKEAALIFFNERLAYMRERNNPQ